MRRRPAARRSRRLGFQRSLSLNHQKPWAGLLVFALLACAALLASPAPAVEPKSGGLDGVYATLMSKRFVDLTHSFGPDTPHWKGFGDMKKRTLYTIDKDGFQVDEICHVGQWGTHVDPPAHPKPRNGTGFPARAIAILR